VTTGILDGVKVIECGSFVAAPYCAKLMADLGAEVIKIETPGTGDESRRRGPFPDDIPHPERSGLFLYLNTNKLGITLNLDSSTGRIIFKQLVTSADILIEDFPPGKMGELGLDYDTLKEINPRLIMTSITPFGQTGPYRDFKAHYLNTFSGGGQSYLIRSGDLDNPSGPLKGGGYLGEYDAGLNAGVATLGALYWQGASGEGQWVDVSKQESLVALERVIFGIYPNEGISGGSPYEQRGRGPVGIKACQDGYMVLVMPEEHQWDNLVELMGNPEWAKDERFKDQFSRAEHNDEIDPHVSQWMMAHTKEEIFRQGQAFSVPVGPVMTAEDIVNSEQLKERGFFQEIDHPVAGKIQHPGIPYIFSGTPNRVERPAPLLGEHDELIICRRLGYTRQDLVRLRESGVI